MQNRRIMRFSPAHFEWEPSCPGHHGSSRKRRWQVMPDALLLATLPFYGSYGMRCSC